MLISRRTPYTRIRNVQRVRTPLSDGRYNFHHYHRPTRTKLPGQPGSPEFIAVYLDCENRIAVHTLVRLFDNKNFLTFDEINKRIGLSKAEVVMLKCDLQVALQREITSRVDLQTPGFFLEA